LKLFYVFLARGAAPEITNLAESREYSFMTREELKIKIRGDGRRRSVRLNCSTAVKSGSSSNLRRMAQTSPTPNGLKWATWSLVRTWSSESLRTHLEQAPYETSGDGEVISPVNRQLLAQLLKTLEWSILLSMVSC
jgi:hypothetical protein